MKYNKLEDLIVAELTILNNINIKFNNIAIINSTLSSILIKSTGFLEQKLHKVFCYRNEQDKEFRDKVFEHAFTPSRYLPRRLSNTIIEVLLNIPKKYIDNYCKKSNITCDERNQLDERIQNLKLSSQNKKEITLNLLSITDEIKQYYTQSAQDYNFLKNYTRNIDLDITTERFLELFNASNNNNFYDFIDELKNKQWLSEDEYNSKKIQDLYNTRNNTTLPQEIHDEIQIKALEYLYDKYKKQQKNILKTMNLDIIKKDVKDTNKTPQTILEIQTVLGVIIDIRNSIAHGQVESVKILGMVKGISYFWLFDRLIIVDEYIEIKLTMLKEILEQ